MRGEFAEAEEAYRQANRWGRQPQPGMAQLRLAQGRVDDARSAMRRVLDEAEDAVTRSRLLAVQVLKLVATGKTNRAIASELVISEKTVATHVSKAWVVVSLRGDGLRLRAPSRLGAPSTELPTRADSDLDISPDAASVGGSLPSSLTIRPPGQKQRDRTDEGGGRHGEQGRSSVDDRRRGGATTAWRVHRRVTTRCGHARVSPTTGMVRSPALAT